MSHIAELEVLLFVAGEDGLTVRELAELLHLQPSALLQQLEKLAEKYETDKDSGLALVETSKRYKLVTKKDYAELLRTYSRTPINQSMSRALLETLSIIAFKQPITKQEIEHIRGVRIERVLARLIELELVREMGRKAVLGRPILYGTTDTFLQCFGLNRLEDLPALPEQEAVDEELAEQLSLLPADEEEKLPE